MALGGAAFIAAGGIDSPGDLAGKAVAFLVSIAVHESAHALVASWLGDDTGRLLGRVTLNPVPHIDVVGSIVLPILFYMTSGTVFGWAKPVPINFLRFRNPVVGLTLSAGAGPVSNLLLAFLFAAIVGVVGRAGDVSDNAGFRMLSYFVSLNVLLGVFNLLPIPPLDGSKVAAIALPERTRDAFLNVEWAGLVLILLLSRAGVLWTVLGPPIAALDEATLAVARFFGG
jgi:Zn-dependent protease